MKRPRELSDRLTRQWQNPSLREARLLHRPGAWPVRFPIGKPCARELEHAFDEVRAIVKEWQQVSIGKVEWFEQRFRATAEPISIPRFWLIERPSDWIKATGDRFIRSEYEVLLEIVARVDERFHVLLIRSFPLWREKGVDETIDVASIALKLTPGCAHGRPLRALAVDGNDTKFFERNRVLLVRLLDVLHDGRVSDLGLEAFLDAAEEGEHWLLVADLDGSLLQFPRMRLQARDLSSQTLPGHNLLLVENERCLHQLPRIPDTIAVLGCGRNLSWLKASWVGGKRIGYWGDLDTWGLGLLSEARNLAPDLVPILMDLATLEKYQESLAVIERVPFGDESPEGLTEAESNLFDVLRRSDRGRLEQEFLPEQIVGEAVLRWARERSQDD